MSKKRHRERPAIDIQLVEVYEDLANEDEGIRLKAAHALLTKIIPLHEANGEKLNQVLIRLIRGLCSGRKAARIGFSIALTEFLTELLRTPKRDEHSFQDISGVLRIFKETTATNGVSAQEERDYLLGRLFGAEAIIQSGILFHAVGNISGWAELLDIILNLARKKAWLREECGYMLYATIQRSRLPNHDLQYAQIALQRLQSHGLMKTPEGVAIWAATRANYPALALPCSVWHNDDPLDRKEKATLAQVLKEAFVTSSAHIDDGQKIAQMGQWNPKIHFAWPAVLPQLFSVPSTELPRKGTNPLTRMTLKEFWDTCVDDNLFAGTASEERKFCGFVLVQQTLLEVPSLQISEIFSPNFMRCLINQLASPDRYLHRAAEKTRKAVIERARSDSSTIASILASLLTPPNGDINFDGATKTKTVEALLSQATKSDMLGNCLRIQDKLIIRPNTKDDKLSESKRQAVADQLITLLRSMQNQSVSGFTTIIASVLSILVKYAYFDIGSSKEAERPEPDISPRSRDMFKSRLSSGLAHLMANKSIDSSCFAYYVVCEMHHPDATHPLGRSLLDVDGKVQGLLDRALDTLTYMDKSRSGKRFSDKSSQATILILSLAVLQVYNGDVEAVSLLEELNGIYNKEQLRRSNSVGTQATLALVEILLSLVSKPSLLLRRLSQQVFTAFTNNIGEKELQLMLKVLQSKESLAGQAEMFDQEDEYMDGGDASDVEVDMADNASSSASEKSEGDTESEETDPSIAEGDDLSDDHDEDLAAFNAKIAQALGTQLGQNDVGAEESSSSDEDMDDEQMEKLDQHLESIFRERKKVTNKKSGKKDAKETIINFKCRVLELLEIFVKNEHDSNRALYLILPILSLIRTTGSSLVSKKACNLIHEHARVCKGGRLPNIPEPDSALDLLRHVHEEAGKEASNVHASACSQASLLLVRILVAHDREQLRRIVGIYASTQERGLFEQTFKVKTSFFTDWLNWCNSAK
ncbi:MAG: hypothetical protein Q9217_005864, partial [Psora testacea]